MTTSQRSQAPPRQLQLPALQAPLTALEAGEFVGISTSRLTSRVVALPDRGRADPCTVTINGPGVLHVLDGSLRIAREGAAKEMELGEGAFMLVKGSDSKLVAPPRRPSKQGAVGARFLWVEVQ